MSAGEEWYYEVDGRPHGPLAWSDLEDLLGRSGETAVDVRIRKGPQGEWTAFRSASSAAGTPHASYAFRLSDVDLLIALVVVESLIIAHWLCRNTPLEIAAIRVPWWTISVGLALMLVAITLSSGESQSFLYFQY